MHRPFRHRFFSLIAFLMFYWTSAQQRIVAIGDTCPNFQFDSILYERAFPYQLEQLKDRLVIIDFFTTTCAACIKALPKLNALQKEYRNSITILLVSPEEKSRVALFKAKNKYAKDIDLPIITNDSIISKHFSESAMPYQVWIYKSKFIAQTSDQYLTEENIEKVLSGIKVDWPVYERKVVDLSTPFFGEQSKTTRVQPRYYSAFKDCDISLIKNSITKLDSVDGTRRYTVINYPILELYMETIYNYPVHNYRNRILVETNDSSRFFHNSTFQSSDDWYRQYAVIYECIAPLNSDRNAFYQKVRTDLDLLLNIKSGFQQRQTNVLVLERSKKETGHESSKANDQLLKLSPEELVVLASGISGIPPIVVDKSLNKAVAEIVIDVAQLKDLGTLRKMLAGQGYELKPQKRKMEFFVISDK